MSNLNFNNNINNNKLECGTIHFSNDLSILITNSTFDNNISKEECCKYNLIWKISSFKYLFNIYY